MVTKGMEGLSRWTQGIVDREAQCLCCTREGETGKLNNLCSSSGSCLMVELLQELRPKVQVS